MSKIIYREKEDRTDIIVRHVKSLIEKYANTEEIKKEFFQEIESSFFSRGESEDEYDPEIAEWRRKMPSITCDDVEVFYDGNNELILWVTGEDDQTLNELYTVITSKVVGELLENPEICKINPSKIHTGDGDEGCIYFEFEGEENRKPWGSFFGR